jgi:hypothetical protein
LYEQTAGLPSFLISEFLLWWLCYRVENLPESLAFRGVHSARYVVRKDVMGSSCDFSMIKSEVQPWQLLETELVEEDDPLTLNR